MLSRWHSALIVLVLLAAAAVAVSGLRLDNDLARFMPAPEGSAQRLLSAEIGEGPGSRLLLLAIAAQDQSEAARLSRRLREDLVASDDFASVHNGEFDELDEVRKVLPLRFSHSPAMDTVRFDSDALAAALEERLADLGSIGGEAFETLLAHDPQWLVLAMVEAWQPAGQPLTRDGVWFSSSGEALLVAHTRAAGFDPQAQAEVIERVQRRFDALAGTGDARLIVSGAGSFSARMSEQVRGEATMLGSTAFAGVMLLLLLAYRRLAYVFAAALPLVCAIAAGLVALRLGFDQAHGITLAFAFTLVGVALDYPVHLLSHARPGLPLATVARGLWPALRLSVASTAIAYLTLFSAQAEGLAQLAVFTIAGLATAALVSRYLLPALLPPARRDVLDGGGLARLSRRLPGQGLGAWPLVPVLLLAGLALVVGQNRPWWNNDLASLTPLPLEWLQEDARLRGELATPDARYLLVLSGADDEAVLQLSEALAPRFQALVDAGTIADHGLPSRYRPSARVQSWRLAKLPSPGSLRAALADAADATGYDAAYFEPMVADVAGLYQADAGARLAAAFAASPAGERYQASMRLGEDGSYALVELYGLVDPDAVGAAVAGVAGAQLLDLKLIAETMVSDFRDRVLVGLAAAAVALLFIVTLVLGPRGMLRVLPPVLIGVVATVAVLRLAGIEMSLFHLIALMLGAGLGMDYAVFFNHARAGADRDRTLHAIMLSAASTVLVFGLLALSSIPVLRAIGLTVAIAVAVQFCLALSMSRRPPERIDGSV